MASELFVQTIKGPTSGVNANKVIIPSGQTLDASAGGMTLPSGVGGKVLQVVQTVKTNAETSSSGSYVDSGLSVTITPSSTSSKVLITVSIQIGCNTGSANVDLRLRNDTAGTNLSSDPRYTDRWPSDGQSAYYCHNLHFEHLDSPSTTSATTYKVQMKTNAGAFQVNQPSNNGGFSNVLVSTMTATEIAG